MSCVEKRHMCHRVGSMLHHRFPNGFSDLFMDETDREVSTLTDRAFRSLCVGDDAVYNDEFLHGYSPFSCHKPLVGEPLKKTHHKESKGHNKTDKNHGQPWKQQKQKSMTHMSSFLNALSATEESCDVTDSNGESWDKSALRSIQRELSEFSSDYHSNLTAGHYKKHHQHQSGNGSSKKSGKDAAATSGKSLKGKHGKSSIKLKKLNIKNFFLHSEFSPFQTWRDFNQYPFGKEDTSIIPTDNIPKWYDLPFYKELTEAHRKETLKIEEVQLCHKAAVDPPPPTAPKPVPPPPPPKVLPQPSATPAEKRCTSEGRDGTAAPWRRNRLRAKSVIPLNQPGVPPQENCLKTVDENLCSIKKVARSVEVKAVEEVSSLASTPFSICQLMTPVIPSRQPTETSEILQSVLSPSSLDLPLRPHSEAKLTPEPPVKRDSYKSLASSILFNLKDNRKRVKSRYSPPKFKTLEEPEVGTQSPESDHLNHTNAGSEGYASGLSTPAILKDGQTVCSPVLVSDSTPTIGNPQLETDRPLSDDFLLSNLLQTKREIISEDNPISPFIRPKKTKSPRTKKQNYPSLNLYKKASPVDSDMKYLVVPLDTGGEQGNELSPLTLNKDLSPKPTGLSPNTLYVKPDRSPLISPRKLDKEELSTTVPVERRTQNVPDKANRLTKDLNEEEIRGKDTSGQPMSTMDVIRAAREAINAAKNKALSAAQSNSINKPISDTEDVRDKEVDNNVADSKELVDSNSSAPENSNVFHVLPSRNEAKLAGIKGHTKKEPPPVPKRNFAKSDLQLSLDKQLTNGDLGETKLDLPQNENRSAPKQGKPKHVFSARQNNYIKYQRYAETEDEEREEFEEGDLNVNTIRMEADEEVLPLREMPDSEHIINDLHALKELERARLSDRILENAKDKLGFINIEEETRAKNDLISKELRNIKKGMLSMRGNTMAKRELFTQKEKDQSKPETFTKIDSNVIVNKALINDNYDKAKLALEEIISDRQKRKTKFTEQDVNPTFDENVVESYVRVEQQKKARKDSTMEAKEKHTTHALKDNDLKERLGDLRDHNYMRQILSQTEPRLGETHRSGSRPALTGKDKTDDLTIKSEKVKHRYTVRRMSEETEDQKEGKKEDAPPVPPRNKKGGNRRDGSVTKETDSPKESVEEETFSIDVKQDRMACLKEAQSTHQEVDRDAGERGTSSVKENWHVANNENSKSTTATDAHQCESISMPSICPESENRLYLLPEFRGNENNILVADVSPANSNTKTPETAKVKRKAPLRPDSLNTLKDNVTNNLAAGEPDKVSRATEETSESVEVPSEIPRDIISPLLLVNGVRVNQSPPDQASLSSKSSYFSVESAQHRNTEMESNVYNSLENLTGEAEEVSEETRNISRNTKPDSDRMEVEYYSLSDQESEQEAAKRPIKSPQKEKEAPSSVSIERDNTTVDQTFAHDENSQMTMSPSNIFLPTLGIPALFKVKDNTFSTKLKHKTVQPWSPRGSLCGSDRGDEVHEVMENPEILPAVALSTRGSTPIQDEVFKPKETPSNTSLPLLSLPLNLQSENPKKAPTGSFLTVPQEEDRMSGISPSSEGVESLTTSAADTADEMGMYAGVSKVPSERSGSTCSGNDSQPGLPKPPIVLPKSEKAVLKAIKLANRRMKKEEAQKSSHRSSQGSSKQRVDRHKTDKSDHKSSSRSSKSSEKNSREQVEDGQRHRSRNGEEHDEQPPEERRGQHDENHQTDVRNKTQSHGSVESNKQNKGALPSVAPERQGRSSNRNLREKTEQRHYSSDRVFSNVPVYKAQLGDRVTSDRLFHRSQSIDRHLGDKVERRLSADTSVNERLEPRTQRIEKSLMDELQQRGRSREKTSRDYRRSHSIDAYPNPNPPPSTLSRQSSYTSQLSRQSSMEHAIITQSFPLTQRKLLQDPDSGQYFFVDMPIQVKTKTFFDPETGSYVQLPVQPPEGSVPQASPLEVLTPPLVVYQGFVPVPLSPMAQKATIQGPHMEPRLRQMHYTEGHPYLEPVYGQHDHVLGEFLGTEELDCPS